MPAPQGFLVHVPVRVCVGRRDAALALGVVHTGMRSAPAALAACMRVQVSTRTHIHSPQRLFEEVQGFRPAGWRLFRACVCLDRQLVQHAGIAALLPAAQPHIEAEGSCARAYDWGRHAVLPASCGMRPGGGVGGCCAAPGTLLAGCSRAWARVGALGECWCVEGYLAWLLLLLRCPGLLRSLCMTVWSVGREPRKEPWSGWQCEGSFGHT